MSNYTKGQPVYLSNGQAAEYVASIDGAHLVRPAYDVGGSYDEPPYTEFGPIVEAENVYLEAPTAAIDAEVKRLEQQLSEVRRQLNAASSELHDATKRNKELKATLAQNKVLEHIDDVLAGKFNFIALPGSWSGPQILPLAEALDQGDRYDKKLKLLSLFGDTNGDLHWELNRYRDGSGAWEVVYPCQSIEEAQQLLQGHYDASVDEWRGRSGENKHYGQAITWAANPPDWLAVPDDVKAYVAERAAAQKAERVAKLQAELQQATQEPPHA